jgi:hypothetical protein
MGKILHGMSRCRLRNNIKIDVKEIFAGCGWDCAGSGWSSMVVSCEHGKEASGSIKGVGYIDKLRDYQLLRRDSSPCHHPFVVN